MTSESPYRLTSKFMCGSGSRLINICGTCDDTRLGIIATGLTLRLDPITIRRSHLCRSVSIES